MLSTLRENKVSWLQASRQETNLNWLGRELGGDELGEKVRERRRGQERLGWEG